jgi:RNA recognition motif-containing protein
MQSNLFVANLDWNVTEAELGTLFNGIGDVLSLRIPTDRETGRSRGFAFVEMASPELAEEAIRQLHEYPVRGRNIVVKYQESQPQSRGPRRPREQYAGGGGYASQGRGGW